MKRFAVIAALLLTTNAAVAGDSYSFDIGDRTVTIDAAPDCRSADCVSVSIPGLLEYNTKRMRRDQREGRPAPGAREERAKPAEPSAAAVQPAPAPTTAPPTPSSPTAAAPTPPAAPEAAKPAPATVVANAPAADPAASLLAMTSAIRRPPSHIARR